MSFFDLTLAMHFAEVNASITLDFLKHILIVDANQSAREIIAEILTFHGIACDHAETQAAAVAQLEAGNMYNAIILEHDMPGMNGIAMAGPLKDTAKGNKPQMIMMYASLDNSQMLKNDGEKLIRSLIPKPVRYQDLILPCRTCTVK